MSPMEQAYLILLLAGLIMIGFEMFLPDGIVGAIGAVALAAAAVVGFFVFDTAWAVLSAMLIFVGSLISLFVWIWIVPKTRVGRALTLTESLATAKAGDNRIDALVGKEGVTLSPLRPSGLARIDGQRIDVLADGVSIESGTPIRVVDVHGNRILVRPLPPP